MKDYQVTDYGIFSDAISTTTKYSESIKNTQTAATEAETTIKDESVFMGPIQENCVQEFSKMTVEMNTMVENFNTLATFLQQSSGNYQAGDQAASTTIENTEATSSTPPTANVQNETSDKKNINTSAVKTGTNVANAVNKYGSELQKAEYATVSENLFTTTTTETINGQPVKVTHVVINNGNQINGAPANGIIIMKK